MEPGVTPPESGPTPGLRPGRGARKRVGFPRPSGAQPLFWEGPGVLPPANFLCPSGTSAGSCPLVKRSKCMTRSNDFKLRDRGIERSEIDCRRQPAG